MTDVAFYILLTFSAAFLAALILGKASKDEPLQKPDAVDLDEHEIFWHKKY